METKPNYIEQQREILKEIDIETFGDSPNMIKKISFVTEDRVISWKPKIKRIKKIYGMNLITKTPMMTDEIPQKLKDLGILINSEGIADILTDYFSTDFQGVTYYFFTSVKTFDKWSICYDKPETEDQEPIK